MTLIPSKACPKPTYKRREPKRGNKGAFNLKTRKRIIERDQGLCVRCGARYEEIHHIVFRSQGGLGTVDNGVCVCHGCHELAHRFDKVRRWFERYKTRHLEVSK